MFPGWFHVRVLRGGVQESNRDCRRTLLYLCKQALITYDAEPNIRHMKTRLAPPSSGRRRSRKTAEKSCKNPNRKVKDGFVRHGQEPGRWQWFGAPSSSSAPSSTAYALDPQGLSGRRRRRRRHPSRWEGSEWLVQTFHILT